MSIVEESNDRIQFTSWVRLASPPILAAHAGVHDPAADRVRVMDPVDSVVLRPVTEADLDLLCGFDTEPGLVGPNWYGFRDARRQRQRFTADGWLGDEDGKLMVTLDGEAVGFVSWSAAGFLAGRYRSIGVVLLPEWRGRGVGTRAQALLCRYLFAHTAIQRIEAGTQPDNLAEQRALEKVGFLREGTLRAAEFRDGTWRDIVVYGILRGESIEPSHS